MEEKVVLFTGASSGIGGYTVQFLVEKKGYRGAIHQFVRIILNSDS
jgi:NAD(P)-dependent dehydrogenase (short-subunit alcohol dehydrogenase family)